MRGKTENSFNHNAMFIVIRILADYSNGEVDPIEVISKHRTKSAAIKKTIKAIKTLWPAVSPWDEMSKEDREKFLKGAEGDLEERGETSLYDEPCGDWEDHWVIREI